MKFNELHLNDYLIKAVQRCGYTTPTPIQQQCIPFILAGHDILGLAQTGTGKTAAFILPTIQHLMAHPGKQIKALVIAPTRELAEQINDFTQTIIKHSRLQSLAVYGGVSKAAQIAKIRRGVDIVIACPGRLLDICNDKAIDLSQVDVLILDEADHMFDKGFLPDIRRIIRLLPVKRQNLVFSATMPDEIKQLAENILVNPKTVQLNPSRSVRNISHSVFTIDQAQKTRLLVQLLADEAMGTTLVFTRTKNKAKNLARVLAQTGLKATSLQGNLSQSKRQQALSGFKDGTYTVLVATDIAARGIDVTGISHVINYDMPDTAEAYIHRTGRTGRAGCTGDALTFATSEDRRLIRVIERSLNKPMSQLDLPQLPAVQHQPVQTTARPHKNTRPAGKSSQVSRKQQRCASNANIFGLAQRGKN